MNDKYIEAAELLALGEFPHHIRKKLNISPRQYSKMVSTQRFQNLYQHYLEKHTNKVMAGLLFEPDTLEEKIRRVRDTALDTIEECLDDGTLQQRSRLAIQTAKLLVGQKLEVSGSLNVDLPEDTVNLIHKTLSELNDG